ncbi:MAG: hypothetical protein KR126chlam6_01458, partial [Candidatus Anoxychlamydiales bacterium]|nr:hypothetical protein [Candidatus Anoxychlamydiales bacterium]
SIEYEYDPYHLKKVIRKDSSGFELYRHEYLNYDLDGNILHQSLINRGSLQQDFDIIGRKIKLETRHFTQTIDLFNLDGTINQMTYKTAFSKDTSKYEYDFLKQLTKEEGLFTKDYSYDSHNNRLEKNNDFYEINDLNQVIKTASDETTYDPNGNPQHKQISDGDIFYKYDALDRLVSIEKTNDYKLEFEYDALHRRTFKKYIKYVNYWFSSEWEEKSDDKYLYDNQNEIAVLDSQNIFKELRVLGNSNLAEIGAAISLEIDNNVYVPIHDIQGNVACAILDNNNVETYRYSAFGEEKIFKNKVEYPESQIKNNWRFSSKRKDESSLIYFGRRYYNTDYGRWVTPDPEGFKDGLNLYAFVLNDPLIKVDLYGLYHLPNPLFYKAMDEASGLKPTQVFDLNKKEISPNKRIYFSNGIYNTFDDAKSSANYLSKMNNNSNIHVIYNEHIGVGSDPLRGAMSLFLGIKSKASKLMQKEWIKYLDKDERNQILHIPHSEAVINTRNALDGVERKYRDRISVVAFAPPSFIPRSFVKDINHYPADKDAITKVDFANRRRFSDSISVLDSSGYEDRHVHGFQHPVYKENLKGHIRKFMLEDE